MSTSNILLLIFLILGPLCSLGAVEQDLAERNGEFALNLYKELVKKSDGNIFFSPISISTAMAMVYLGTRGNTGTEMAQALKFNDFDQLHETFKLLSAVLKGTEDYNLEIANRLFCRREYAPNADYVTDVENFYGAGLEKLDFLGDPEGSRIFINEWVEDKTQDKIKDLLPSGSIDPNTALILINAIYFKGTWKLQFNQSLTTTGDFYQSNCLFPVQPQMMTMAEKATFNYFKSSQLKATLLSLPYEGDQLDMAIILPDTVNGLSDLESRITIDNLSDALDSLVETEISKIKIPRFKLTKTEKLVEHFRDLGVSDLFNPSQADLSGIGNDLFVSGIVHKAYIDVNEEGTEAAAATGIIISITSVRPTINFIADHPFMFLIRDKSTNSILFMGRLVEPSTEDGNNVEDGLCSTALSLSASFTLCITVMLFQRFS